jgi:hypothetical protein
MTIFDFENKCQQFFESFLLFYSGWNRGQISKVEVKKQHSLRVSELSGIIAGSLNLEREDIALARIIGLLHDLGRFPQLLKYNTFDDAVSTDHSVLAIEEMERVNLFQGSSEEIVSVVKTAVIQHNKDILPETLTDRERLFCRILRDANKLDNLEVLTNYYSDPTKSAEHTLSWEVPAGRGISEPVASAVKSGKTVSREKIRTGEDMKVMQLSWVYDLNFKVSFRILSRGQFVDKIYRTLPKRDEVFDIYRVVRIYVENKFIN